MSLFRRQQQGPYRFAALATYNAERARGLLHSQEWIERMAEEQRTFDWLNGLTQVPGGPRDSGKPARPPDNPSYPTIWQAPNPAREPINFGGFNAMTDPLSPPVFGASAIPSAASPEGNDGAAGGESSPASSPKEGA